MNRRSPVFQVLYRDTWAMRASTGNSISAVESDCTVSPFLSRLKDRFWMSPPALRGNELPGQHGRPVEGLGLLPGLAGGLECRLHVPRGEIEAKSDGRVTPAGMLLPIHLAARSIRTITSTSSGNPPSIREWQRVILVEDGALRLEEEQRLGWNGIAEFRSVLRIVPADADDFHEAKVTHAEESRLRVNRPAAAPPPDGRRPHPIRAGFPRNGRRPPVRETPRSRR